VFHFRSLKSFTVFGEMLSYGLDDALLEQNVTSPTAFSIQEEASMVGRSQDMTTVKWSSAISTRIDGC
jgi:hypothetical protein